MSEPQLSVRSAWARDLACELARREGRIVAEIEQALELHRSRGARYESAADFYRRLTRDRKEDVDLDAYWLSTASRSP
jgi:hypothetical protein